MIVLKELLRRPIAFHRVFVDIAGSVNAALFLSQACYWSEITDWDWFYKTQQEWEKETGLTRHEQDAARRKLMQLELIQEARRGVPARMFYRVNGAILADLIAAFRQTGLPDDPQSRLPKTGNLYKEAETTTEITAKITKIDAVEELYSLYPRKVAKQNALTAIRRALQRLNSAERPAGVSDVLQWLRDRVITFASSPKGNAGEFTPHPATWFNGSRYLDDEKEWFIEREQHGASKTSYQQRARQEQEIAARFAREHPARANGQAFD